MFSDLPAAALLPSLHQAIDVGNVIVGAPPGAGKSTVLPLALLANTRQKILLLQPRRVVVRNLAGFLASQLGENVGETVGYRVRGESKVSSKTRLEIVTEGVLTRLIQQDPELSGIDIIIFDEFHERSIHSDFGLALALEVQEGLRDDLRIIIMSATLDVDELTTLMPQAQVLKSEGRQFPVEEVYLGQTPMHQVVAKTTDALRNSLNADDGDILVFLPGAGLINQVAREAAGLFQHQQVAVHTLYGAMDKDAQLAALQTDAQGRRKVILATNIAETSLTIEGVTVVIDSGLENVATYHPATALTQLDMQMISQASATQRKGRAGRLGPGKVYRLWSKDSHHRLSAFALPQILTTDISSLMLDTASWGTDIPSLAMLTQPTTTQISLTRTSLATIGALDEHGMLTRYGRDLATLPVAPALGHMLFASRQVADAMALPGLSEAACFCAALVEENPASGTHLHVSDWLKGAEKFVVSRITQQAARLAKQLGIALTRSLLAIESREWSICLALSFPQRIAWKRATGDYKLACGKGAKLPDGMSDNALWLAILSGQVNGGDVTIRLAEPIAEADLRALYPNAFKSRDALTFNGPKKQMEARRVEGFHAITLTSVPIGNVSASVWGEAWFELLDNLPLAQWPLSERDWQWWHRLTLARHLALPQPQAFDQAPPWPDTASPLLLLDKASAVKKLSGCRHWDQLAAIPWSSLCHQSLEWSQQHALDTLLPEKIQIPTGDSRKLDYHPDGQVILAVRMQEMFGCDEKLTVADGRKVVTLELLSPAGRPLQKTADLPAFWRGSYFAIQKEMKGRYPKHRWPDDPLSAEAGRSIKPRKPAT